MAVFKGAINFGLINIPVSLDLAVSKEDVSFRMLHKECGNPVEYKRYCPKCKREVLLKDIIKGFEYAKDKFVFVDKQELEAFKSKENKTIDIINFVKLSEIDPIFFDKAYYLNPEKNGEKAYQILLNAMDKSKRIAVGKFTIRDKEHLCVLRVYRNVFLLSTMFYPGEIKSVKTRTKKTVVESEVKMAKDIIENLTKEFKPDEYVNENRNQIMKLIDKKVKKKEFRVIENKVKNTNKKTDSLFERLKASIEENKKRKVA